MIEYLASAGTPTRAFEIGQIFARAGEQVAEHTALGFGFSAIRGDEPPWRDSAFLRLKGDCEALLRAVTGRLPEIVPGESSGFHPGKTGIVTIDDSKVGVLGCIDPRLTKARNLAANAYLCLVDVGAIPPYVTPRYRVPSRFPSTKQGYAFAARLRALVRRGSITAEDADFESSIVTMPVLPG